MSTTSMSTSATTSSQVSSRKRKNMIRYAKYHNREVKSDATLIREYRGERDELRIQVKQAEESENKIRAKLDDLTVAKNIECDNFRAERNYFKNKYEDLKIEADQDNRASSPGAERTTSSSDSFRSLKRRLKAEEATSESLRIKLKHKNKSVARQDAFIEELKTKNENLIEEVKKEKIEKTNAINEFKNFNNAHENLTMERDMNQYHLIQLYESATETYDYARRASLSVDGLSGGRLDDPEYRESRAKHIKAKYGFKEALWINSSFKF